MFPLEVCLERNHKRERDRCRRRDAAHERQAEGADVWRRVLQDYCGQGQAQGITGCFGISLSILTTTPHAHRITDIVSRRELPPRSMVGQQILDLLIGVRIPGGQPNINLPRERLTLTISLIVPLPDDLTLETPIDVLWKSIFFGNLNLQVFNRGITPLDEALVRYAERAVLGRRFILQQLQGAKNVEATQKV